MVSTIGLSQTQYVEQAPIRVLIDGRKLFDGGIGVYTRNCIAGLLASGHIVGVILTDEAYATAAEQQLHWLDAVQVHIDNAGRYSLDEYIGLANRVPVTAYDIYHSPHYTLPFGISIPKVVTVHDLIHITHPEKKFYPLVARTLISSAIKRADAIVTVSNASARVLRKEFGEAISKKLAVIPNSVSMGATYPGSQPAPDKPFLLAVFSTLKAHKGFEDLLRAYQNYVSRCEESPMPLVLVGQGFTNAEGVSRQIDSLGLRPFVQVQGLVSHKKLHALYAQAHAVVIASHEEGFCIPVIEAHAAGTPVVVRPVPAITELVLAGDSVAKDFDLKSFADALWLAAEKNVDRSNVQDLFSRQVEEQFAPEVTTERLIRVYRTALRDGEA